MKTKEIKKLFKEYKSLYKSKLGRAELNSNVSEVKFEALEVAEELLFDYPVEWEDFGVFEDIVIEFNAEGYFHEVIERAVPIYNYKLFDWAKNYYEFVDDAKQEGLIEDSADLIQQLRGGYYYHMEQLLRDTLYEFGMFLEKAEDEKARA